MTDPATHRIFGMNSKQVKTFQKQLQLWFKEHQRPMPWRDTNDPYKIWVSEVMLQQTQVQTVIPYFEKFIKQFPDLESLAKAGQHDLLKAWEGLGYYARARNLLSAAQLINKNHTGRIPEHATDFKQLPGVGDYISAAVLSIAFGLPMAVVDGNVKRVLARIFMINEPVNNSSSTGIFKEKSELLLDKIRPGTHNQAMMELGALICKPQNPACKKCVVQQFCLSFGKNQIANYPKRTKKKPVPEYRITIGIIFKNNKFLITLRKPDGLLGGLWEFPGGKIEEDESPEQACLREIKEEVNLKVDIVSHLAQIKHAYTHFKIRMEVFICRYLAGRIKLNGPVDHRWITLNQIDEFAFPKANHKFFPILRTQWKSFVD